MNATQILPRPSIHGVAIVLAAFNLAAAAISHADTENVETKSFPVSPGGRLAVRSDRGSIELIAGAPDAVHIQVYRRVKASSTAKAEELIKQHRVSFQKTGNEISVTGETDGWPNWSFGRSSLEVRYVITLPPEFNANLKTAGGSISVPELKGELDGATSGGSLRFGHIQGPLRGKTSGGTITVGQAETSADLLTSGGSIKAGTLNAPSHLATSGGSIEISNALASVTAKTSGGSIRLHAAAGPVDATTSGGSIHARLAGQLTGDFRLATSGGSVEVFGGEDLNARLDAKTSGGRVTSDLPVAAQGEKNNSVLTGTLNHGGPLIHLRTSGGSIRLKKLER